MDYTKLRYLDASESGLQGSGVSTLRMLIFLRLRHCNLTSVSGLNQLPNLQTLDLSHNQLTSVSIADLSALINLHSLWLDGNKPIQHAHLASDFSFQKASQGTDSNDVIVI
jgi:Leucine-rich repeat (LRR) protein